MYVYCENITPRLEFVLQVLTSQLGIQFELTESLNSDGSFINYSKSEQQNSLWILPEGLLNESGIRKDAPVTDLIAKQLFTSKAKDPYPFDVFSAIFYMLSRYEEYMPFKGDTHGRFSSSDSIIAKLDSLLFPLVDQWILDFGNKLKSLFQTYPIYPDYQYIPTVDIDIAFAYRHRPMWLTLANYGREIFNGNFKKSKTRFLTNVGLKDDAYDTFPLLKETYQKDDAHLFFQVGQRGTFDKNLSPWHPEMKKLIFSCAQWATVGLHPSYQSNSDVSLLDAEKNVLETILNAPPETNRQHFLKLCFPDTFQNLQKAGFQKDFTLGFADAIGFRAGTAHPFPFYDIEHETIGELMIYPLSIMDGTLKDYMGLSQKEAKENITIIIEQIKRVNGVFVSLWHNTSFSEIENWTDWVDVFKFMHSKAKA